MLHLLLSQITPTSLSYLSQETSSTEQVMSQNIHPEAAQ